MNVVAEFVASAARPDDFPRDGLPEVALVGRSNVGKSTLVNALVGRRVARTSAAPGKTRLINFYRARVGSHTLYLADLPGYGYTRGGAAARQMFDALSRQYFSRRAPQGGRMLAAPEGGASEYRARVHALLLVDSRHPGLSSDLAARAWLEELAVPTTVVTTKIDKLTRAQRPRALRELDAALHARVVPTSASTGEGLKELWTVILAQLGLK